MKYLFFDFRNNFFFKSLCFFKSFYMFQIHKNYQSFFRKKLFFLPILLTSPFTRIDFLQNNLFLPRLISLRFFELINSQNNHLF